jgi:fimbrial chaperone protein
VQRPVGLILSIVLVLFLLNTEEGRTSTFNVSPLKIVLSGKSSSALLEITNQSAEPLRLQLSVSSWDQSPTGQMLLQETEEIILFPPLLTVEPGEKRKIRLGAVTPRDLTEKSYRIILEELPPPADSSAAAGNQIRVLTRMTIPVFLEPSKLITSGQIAGLTIGHATTSFEIRNTGNTHFSVQQVELVGTGPTGQPLLTRRVDGWYVLAGGARRYDLPLSTDECRGLRMVSVEARTDAGPLTARLDLPAEGCGR